MADLLKEKKRDENILKEEGGDTAKKVKYSAEIETL